MANGMLSQEEIDALLSGAMETELSGNSELNSESRNVDEYLSDLDNDVLGEIANISMGTAATTLSQLVGKRVEITTPVVDVTNAKTILQDYPVPHVLIHVKYKRGFEGSNILILSQEDGSVIVDLMMGGSGEKRDANLNEMQLSGISEAMNQMMGSAATSMSTVFNSVIDITPPTVIVAEINEEETQLKEILGYEEHLVRISFRLTIEGILDSVLLQIIPLEIAKSMAAKLIGGIGKTTESPALSGQASAQEPSISINTPPSPAPPEPMEPMFSGPPPSSVPPLSAAPAANNSQPQTLNNGHMSSMNGAKKSPVEPNSKPQTTFVQPAQFAQLSVGNPPSITHNLGLIADVPLQVNVELGKATKTIKEILELGPGSVVELDRLAGEPVDMFVNGKLIAKCEVVVINETFGIRITEIVSPSNRIDTIN
ncbi:MAG: flagellar motor switch phosphatase FliY [Peptococcaceae bacterium]|nr:flagellar motor switch phosphatase FliY [Peptococcaceae bacterium]